MINTTSQTVGLYNEQGTLVQTFEPDQEHRLSMKIETTVLCEHYLGWMPVFAPPVWKGIAGKWPSDERADILVSPQVAQFIATETHQVDGREERVADTISAAGFRVYGLNLSTTEVVIDSTGKFLGSRSLVRYV